MSRVPRGAALLLVMWLILLLSGLVAGYAMAARIESMQGNGLARGTTAREAARAGVEYATARMLDPDSERRWAADGRDYRFAFDGAQVEISVRDELGKIDLNAAGHDLLAAFFVALGEPREAAVRLRRGSRLRGGGAGLGRQGRAVRDRGRTGTGAGHATAAVRRRGAVPDRVQRRGDARREQRGRHRAAGDGRGSA